MNEEDGGLGEAGRMDGDEGKRVDGISKQLDEGQKQKIGWKMKETGRVLLGREKISRSWSLTQG